MKKTTILLMLIAMCLPAILKAQDIIVTKHGESISALIMDETPTDIMYKNKERHHHSSRHTYTIAKSDVIEIRYNSGRTEKFDKQPAPPEIVSKQSEPAIESNNVEGNVGGERPSTNDMPEHRKDITSETPTSKHDRIYLHNGTVIDGYVLRVAEYTIIYKYQNENSEQVIGKYAVDKIVHANSSRVEKITERVTASSAQDWENVVMLEDKSQITGLTKVDEIRGKATNWSGLSDMNNMDAKSTRKMKEAAAEMGCPFILLTNSLNGRDQSIRKGIGYRY